MKSALGRLRNFFDVFCCKNWSPKLPKRGINIFSITNIDRFEKKTLEPSLPALLDFPVYCLNCTIKWIERDENNYNIKITFTSCLFESSGSSWVKHMHLNKLAKENSRPPFSATPPAEVCCMRNPRSRYHLSFELFGSW